MPGEEKPRGMDELGVEDVCGYEVIVSRTGTWSLGGIDLGWQSVQTFDGLNVLQTSLIVQITPAIPMSLSTI